jgi:F-type H+-transporting ATPase subunit epsilon
MRFRLTIATPASLLVDESEVVSIRAEDDSGGFGFLPGHTDFLTVTPACVVRWRRSDGAARCCAIRGGVLTVARGNRVAIACRHGVLGDDVQALEAGVREARAARMDEAARARVAQTRLHASAVRRLVRCLRPAGLPETIFSNGEGGAQ